MNTEKQETNLSNLLVNEKRLTKLGSILMTILVLSILDVILKQKIKLTKKR